MTTKNILVLLGGSGKWVAAEITGETFVARRKAQGRQPDNKPDWQGEINRRLYGQAARQAVTDEIIRQVAAGKINSDSAAISGGTEFTITVEL